MVEYNAAAPVVIAKFAPVNESLSRHPRQDGQVVDLRLVFYRQSLTEWLLRRHVVGFGLS